MNVYKSVLLANKIQVWLVLARTSSRRHRDYSGDGRWFHWMQGGGNKIRKLFRG